MGIYVIVIITIMFQNQARSPVRGGLAPDDPLQQFVADDPVEDTINTKSGTNALHVSYVFVCFGFLPSV